jgi:hypothetical protein
MVVFCLYGPNHWLILPTESASRDVESPDNEPWRFVSLRGLRLLGEGRFIGYLVNFRLTLVSKRVPCMLKAMYHHAATTLRSETVVECTYHGQS